VGTVCVWHGDTAQVQQLLAAIELNCTCRDKSGSCTAHQALLSQRFLDGLLYARWLREQLLAEEFR
jgi:hypothetical protein